MPRINFNQTPEKQAAIEAILPKYPLINALHSAFWEMAKGILLKILLEEIEVYKAHPKYNSKYNKDAFNPRNGKTCFMGLGFHMNGQGGYEDTDLIQYRERVGTLHHPVWGEAVTLLEIWGADHFERWPEMVQGVFKYCYGKGKLPVVQFHVNPLIYGPDSGTYQPDEADLAERRSMQLAGENELRRQHGLPFQDYLASEIEEYRKADNWSEKHRCPKDQIHNRRRLNRDSDDD